MKKVKLDATSEKSGGAFFDDEISDQDESLNSANSAARLSKIETNENSANDGAFFITALKRLFLFLPGAFLLFVTSFGIAVIAMEIIVFRREIQTLPDDYPFQFAFIGFIEILAILMTWFGLGDIKNRKHFAIPASLMLTGAIVGAFVKVAAKFSDFADRMLDDFDYLIYLLPLALIVPVLAKGWADREPKDV